MLLISLISDLYELSVNSDDNLICDAMFYIKSGSRCLNDNHFQMLVALLPMETKAPAVVWLTTFLKKIVNMHDKKVNI